MASIVTIIPTADSSKCEIGQTASFCFTIKNTTGQALTLGCSVNVSGGAERAWCTVDGAPERKLDPDELGTVYVDVAVPPDAAAGKYLFQLVVFDQLQPGERFTESPMVSLAVSAHATSHPNAKPAAGGGRRTILIWAGAVVGLAVIGVVSYAVVSRLGAESVPDVTGTTRRAAIEKLASRNYLVGNIFEEKTGTEAPDVVLRQDPPGGTEAQSGTRIDLTIESGKPFLILGKSNWGESVW